MNQLRATLGLLLLPLLLAACFRPGTTSPRELTAESNGVLLYVRVGGDPSSGNVVITIHGGPGMTHDYRLNLESLAGLELAVVTYDERGVTRSPARTFPLRWIAKSFFRVSIRSYHRRLST